MGCLGMAPAPQGVSELNSPSCVPLNKGGLPGLLWTRSERHPTPTAVVPLCCCVVSPLLSVPCPQQGQAQTWHHPPGEATPVWGEMGADASAEEEERWVGSGTVQRCRSFTGLVRQRRGKYFQLLLRCSVHLLLHSWLAKWLQEQSRPRWVAEADQKQRVLGALGRAGVGRELVLIDPRLILKVRKRKINFGGLGGGVSFNHLQVMQGWEIAER